MDLKNLKNKQNFAENSENQVQNPEKKVQKIVGLLFLEAGIEFAILIALPLMGGVWLGKLLNAKTGQKFYIIIGVLLGTLITVFAISKRIKEYQKILNNKGSSWHR